MVSTVKMNHPNRKLRKVPYVSEHNKELVVGLAKKMEVSVVKTIKFSEPTLKLHTGHPVLTWGLKTK